uniref:Probable RNA-binding protein EIF1AD n=1 Tax=Ornithorhynchus anatinus TaxID=9258 RepID=A0A6I8N6F4_ORNAN
MPSKYRKNIWIKRGDYLIVDPIEEGEKVKAEISFVLCKDHVRSLQEDGLWYGARGPRMSGREEAGDRATPTEVTRPRLPPRGILPRATRGFNFLFLHSPLLQARSILRRGREARRQEQVRREGRGRGTLPGPGGGSRGKGKIGPPVSFSLSVSGPPNPCLLRSSSSFLRRIMSVFVKRLLRAEHRCKRWGRWRVVRLAHGRLPLFIPI